MALATAAFYVDPLAEHGPLLSEPYTRQFDGKLRELQCIAAAHTADDNGEE
jgi:hypothetical protein